MKILKTESDVKADVKKFLKKNKLYFFMPSASMYGRSGVSDFVVCVGGRYVAIETKAPADGEKGLTPLQLKHKADVLEAGAMWFCAYDWPTLDTLFAELLSLKMQENTEDVYCVCQGQK